MLSEKRLKCMKALGIKIHEQEMSANMNRHTQNTFMGDTESQCYNTLIKQITRHKQFGILIPGALTKELVKLAKSLKNKSNVESIIDNGKIATTKALGMAIPIQENKEINKTTEVNRERYSKLFGIRKLGSKVKSIVHPKAELELQKVNARIVSAGIAGLRADNVKKKKILNVKVNKIKGKLASRETGRSDQGRTQQLGTIDEKVVDQRHMLEYIPDKIHMLESCFDQMHMLYSSDE